MPLTTISRQFSAFGRRVAATINAARGRLPRPEEGKTVQAAEAAVADYFRGDLTPSRIKTALETAAYGDPSEQNQIFDTMLDRDGYLAGEYGKRRLAVTGLPWALKPASEVGRHPRINEQMAARVHEFCAEALAGIEGCDEALRDLTDAIGRGLMVAEIEWLGGRPIRMQTLSPTLIHSDSQASRRLRVITSDNDWQGVLLDEFPAGKFIVHQPATIGGSRFRGGLLRAAIFGWMLKRFGYKAWATGLELFGLPLTVAKYGSEADSKVRAELTELIRNLGVNRGGVFPAGCEVLFAESKAIGTTGGFPHERMIEFVNKEYSIEFLGVTLTTQITETGGANAAAQTHNEVRGDLRDDDIRNEGTTIRDQLLVPLAMMEFGEAGRLHAPYFTRVIEEAKDLGATADLIDKAVNNLGAPVPMSIVSTELGLPLVEGTDETQPLTGRAVSFQPSAFSHRRAAARCACGGHRVCVHKAASASPLARLEPWVAEAINAGSAHAGQVVADFGNRIAAAATLMAVRADLPGVFARLPIDNLVETERHYLLAGQLAGMMHARRLIVSPRPSSASKAARRKRGVTRRVVGAEGAIDFAEIPFVEAIRMLRERLGVDPETFESLDAAARSRAWRVAGVWNMAMLAEIHRELLASIEAGATARDFRLRLPTMAERNGWSGENPWHAAIVQRQNVTMAHAAGRAQEYAEYDVPAWRFVAYDESSACPICAPLNGKVFQQDDRAYWPPLHFNCRCMDEPVFEGEARPDEVADSADVDVPALDDEQARPSGFKWDVAQYANLEPIDLSQFPAELRAAFEAFAKEHDWEIAQ